MNGDVAYFPDLAVDTNDPGATSSSPPKGQIEASGAGVQRSPLSERTQSHCEISDESLLSSVAKGDRDALASLFSRCAKSIYNIALRILRNGSEAEDLVQEVFLFVFKKADLFDPTKSSAKSWLIQVTYHRAFDRRRYLSTRNYYHLEKLDDDLCPSGHLDIEQASVNGIAAHEILIRFQSELSSEQQVTLRMHFFEGYSLKEIAEQSGQTLGNVRNHYYRGLARLRACVASQKAFSE